MTNQLLTPAELQRFTGQSRVPRQVATLVKMGVPFRFGGGLVLVAREVAEAFPQWDQREVMQRPRLDLVA